MRTRVIRALLVVMLIGVATVSVGCSGDSECDTCSSTSDCDSGQICREATDGNSRCFKQDETECTASLL